MATNVSLNGSFMTEEEQAEAAKTAEVKAADEGKVIKNKPRKHAGKYSRITIPKSDDPNKLDRPVPVSLNGQAWLLHRGVEIIVPDAVVEILRNAVENKYSTDEETGDQLVYEVPAYTALVLGPATEAEYKSQKIAYGRQDAPGSR